MSIYDTYNVDMSRCNGPCLSIYDTYNMDMLRCNVSCLYITHIMWIRRDVTGHVYLYMTHFIWICSTFHVSYLCIIHCEMIRYDNDSAWYGDNMCHICI